MDQRTSQQGSAVIGQAPSADAVLLAYVSTSAQKLAPGNFVTTWNPDLGRAAVGVTRAVEDAQEANPRILVRWMHDLNEEWVRSEYLYLVEAA